MRYFIIYKTTNRINGMAYIGKHETSNLNDGYLGSGIYLTNAIKKYGKENFITEVLFFCQDRVSLNAAEKELVTEDIVQSPQYYNIAPGGQGGDLGQCMKYDRNDAYRKHMSKVKQGSIRSEESNEKARNTINSNYAVMPKQERIDKFGHKGELNGFFSKSHTEESLDKIRAAIKLQDRHLNNPNAKPVTVNGITYPLMSSAMSALGISRNKLIKLLGENQC